MIINLARRAHDHNWALDPITRSLLDTDFYKLLMLQFIWKRFPQTTASFSLSNRSPELRLGELIDIGELREQLERSVRGALPPDELSRLMKEGEALTDEGAVLLALQD